MNPTKELIEEWIEKCHSWATNKIIEFDDISSYTNNPPRYVYNFIIEMLVQINRWDLIMNYLFVHPSTVRFLTTHLFGSLDPPDKYVTHTTIWGSKIIANNHIPNNMMIGFSETNSSADSRNIVLAKLNLEMLNKLDQMKAFW